MEVERKGKATAQREERNARENENTNPETTRNPSTEVIHLVGNLIEENEKRNLFLVRSRKEKSPRSYDEMCQQIEKKTNSNPNPNSNLSQT